MRAANPKEARAEGQKVALLLNKLVDLAPTRQFQDASKFGQFFAMDVLGYRDGELAIAWTEGFCNGLMEPEKAERVAAQYVDGKLDITALLKLPPGAFSPTVDQDEAA